MTGPEHYREAEQALAEARKLGDQFNGQDLPASQVGALVAMMSTFMNAAQVHATLALAAATMRAGDNS